MLLGAVWEVIKRVEPGRRESMAIVLGADNAIDGCKEGYWKEVVANGPLGASPLAFPYTSANAVTAQATIAFGIRGESATIVNGPLSFFNAAAYGFRLIANGIASEALAGGFSEGGAFAMTMTSRPDDADGCRELVEVREDGAVATAYAPVTSIGESFHIMASALESAGTIIKAVDKKGLNMVVIEVTCNADKRD